MTDYSGILDGYIYNDTIIVSSDGRGSNEAALIEVDSDGEVSFSVTSYYGCGCIRTRGRRCFVIADACGENREFNGIALDGSKLREDLAGGGRLSILLDAFIGGMDDDTPAALDASMDIECIFDGKAYHLHEPVWHAHEWVRLFHANPEAVLAEAGLTVDSTHDEIEAAAADAKYAVPNDVIMVGTITDGLLDVVRELRERPVPAV